MKNSLERIILHSLVILCEAFYLSTMLDETLGKLEFVARKQLFAVVTADVHISLKHP